MLFRNKYIIFVVLFIIVISFQCSNSNAQFYGKSYALVIGISKYSSLRFKNLTYSRKNAEQMALFLKKQGFIVSTLYDRDATRTAIIAKMQKYLAEVLRSNDRVLIYFSGHGYADIGGSNLSYIVPYDSENIETNINIIYISMDDILFQSKKMNKARHQLFIIDAPFTGIQSIGTGGTDPTIPNYLQIINSKKARQILTAGDNNISDDINNNLITKFFFEAFENRQGDINNDGYITFTEICSFIAPKATNSNNTILYGTLPDHNNGEFNFKLSMIKSIADINANQNKTIQTSSIENEKTLQKEQEINKEEQNNKQKNLTQQDRMSQKVSLKINTKPEDARIRILNIVQSFQQSMKLKPGDYKIEVSKTGYIKQEKWIALIGGRDLTVDISLQKDPLYSRLYVKTDPDDAIVKIMNIVPPYKPGILLKSGKYHIKAAKKGYETINQWIFLEPGKDENILISLDSTGLKDKYVKKTETDKIQETSINEKEETERNKSVAEKEKQIAEKEKQIQEKEIQEKKIQEKEIQEKKIQEKEIQEKKIQEKEIQEKEIQEKKIQVHKEEKQVHEKEKTIAKIDSEINKKNEIKTPVEAIYKQADIIPDKPLTDSKQLEIIDKSSINSKKIESQQEIEIKQEILSKDKKIWKETLTGMEFIYLEGGCYDMGCSDFAGKCNDDELPAHNVCIDSFWIGKYEVTQGQWKKIMNNNPSLSTYGDNYPVEKISYDQAKTFIKELNKKTKIRFRLPTEAEWEYACRSKGKNHKYSGGGKDLNYVAWYSCNSEFTTHAVGTKAPNESGIFDLSGNVAEWCQDSYSSSWYKNSKSKNPVNNSNSKNKIARGGDWSDKISNLRCTNRSYFDENIKSKDLGLRLVRDQN